MPEYQDNENPLLELLYSGQRKYAQQIGEIVIAWNSLHSVMFMWFYKTSDLKFDTAKRLWECGASDTQQRNMLRTLDTEIKEKEIKKEVLWMLDTTDKLSQYRNSLIHTPVLFNTNTLNLDVVDTATKIKHAEKVKLIQKKDLFKSLKKDINNLERYFFALYSIKFSEKKYAWPNRPTLTAFPEQIQDKKKKTHPDNQTIPDLPPQSSEG